MNLFKTISAIALVSAACSFPVSASEMGDLHLLRIVNISTEAPPALMKPVNETKKAMPREFVQPPPLVPHGVENKMVNKDVNTSLQCHTPQAIAEPLIKNNFQPVDALK